MIGFKLKTQKGHFVFGAFWKQRFAQKTIHKSAPENQPLLPGAVAQTVDVPTDPSLLDLRTQAVRGKQRDSSTHTNRRRSVQRPCLRTK